MKVAIMQPYFLPYIGYFQLIQAADVFVVYDNIQFSKKGWFHRNRILCHQKDEYISLPLKKDSDFLDVNQRHLSLSWPEEKIKLLRKIKESYRKAPFFEIHFDWIEDILNHPAENLFDFIYYSLRQTMELLDIQTKIVISSQIDIDHNLRGKNKVLAICKKLAATHYINPIGGLELYDTPTFKENGLQLSFIKALPFAYTQFSHTFVPWLSIIDVLMFNDMAIIKDQLTKFELIKHS